MSRVSLIFTRTKGRVFYVALSFFLMLLVLSHNIFQTQEYYFSAKFITNDNELVEFSFLAYTLSFRVGNWEFANMATGLRIEDKVGLSGADLDARRAAAVRLLASLARQPMRNDARLHDAILATQVLVPLVLSGIVLLWLLRIKHKVLQNNLCMFCGYCLEGSPSSKCPECGKFQVALEK